MRKSFLAVLAVFYCGLAVCVPQARAEEQKFKQVCPPGTIPYGAPPPAGKKIWCRQPMRDGTYIRQGKFAAFYPNGKKHIDGNFEGDKPHGTWTDYDRNGHKVSETTFYDGKEIKKVKYDRMGKPIDVKEKDQRNGQQQDLTDWSGRRSARQKKLQQHSH